MSIKAINDVLDYIMREGAQLEDTTGKKLLIRQHVRGTNTKEWAREFVINEGKRKAKNKRARGLYHCIISLHPKDSSKITIPMLERIAKEFVRLRCPNSLVVCTAHMDDHIHMHLVVSGVQFGTGESIRLEKKQFTDILKSMSQFQSMEFPELEYSIVDFAGTKQTKDNEYQMKVKGKIPEKQLIIAYTKAAYETARTFDDFAETLRSEGFEPYERNGRIIGVKGVKKYRLKTLGITIDKFRKFEKER